MDGRNNVSNSARFSVRNLPGLSKKAFKFAREHPREAKIAVTAALEPTAAQHQLQSATIGADFPEPLKPFLIDRSSGSEMIGVSEAAVRLRISRTTVYDWIGKRMLLAWKTTKRGLVIPAEQIMGQGHIAPGMLEVLEIVEDPELAWTFLSEEWPFADKFARPIDKLKAGDIEEVVNAASGFGTVFT